MGPHFVREHRWDRLDSDCMFPIRSGMHTPPFSPNDRLSDWPECRVEARCPACRHAAFIPTRMIRASHGDRTFREVLKLLRCGLCKAKPAPIFLLAGHTREHCYGGPPDWAIELVPTRR